MTLDALPLNPDSFLEQLALDRRQWSSGDDLYYPRHIKDLAQVVDILFSLGEHPQIQKTLDKLTKATRFFTSDPQRFPELAAYLQLQECANGQSYFGLVMTSDHALPIFLALYRGSTHWQVLPVLYDMSQPNYALTVGETLEQTLGRLSSTLKPCPFCGHTTPYFERIGTRRASCIVVCGYCSGSHESSDEDENNGRSWNHRIAPESLTEALTRLQRTAYLDSAVSVQARTDDLKAVLAYFGIESPQPLD
jgi:hypothetical protein